MLGSSNALYIEIANKLVTSIIKKEYNLGDKLPTVRDLAYEYEANPLTIQKSYALLEKRNVVIAKIGSGKYLTENQNIIDGLKKEVINELIEEFIFNIKEYEIDKMEVIKIIKELYE